LCSPFRCCSDFLEPEGGVSFIQIRANLQTE
jgi:hypothetical protein